MNNQLRNMLEAGLKPPPAPKDVMAYLIQQKEGSNKPAANVDPIFGNIFTNPAGGEDVLVGKAKKKGKVCQSATRWFNEWHEIAKDTEGYETLDKWLVGFVRYAMVADLLCETVEQANALTALRSQQWPEGKKGLDTSTIRTYVNSMCAVWNRSNTEWRIIGSSEMQFPEYNTTMQDCNLRWKTRKLVTKVQEGPKKLLLDEDLPKLWAKTDFTDDVSHQRMNITLITFRTGLRKETLMLIELDVVEVENFENGKVKITLNIAKMKNMQPKLKKIDELLFSQAIISAEVKEGCGAEAMLRQMELAKRIGPDPTTGKNMLFHATKKFAPQTLSTKGATEATFMSVVEWTKSVLGRHLTMVNDGERWSKNRVRTRFSQRKPVHEHIFCNRSPIPSGRCHHVLEYPLESRRSKMPAVLR